MNRRGFLRGALAAGMLGLGAILRTPTERKRVTVHEFSVNTGDGWVTACSKQESLERLFERAIREAYGVDSYFQGEA